MGLKFSVVIRDQMTVDSTSAFKTLAAVGALVIESSHVSSFVISECSHVLQNLLADFTRQCGRIEAGFVNLRPRTGAEVKTCIHGDVGGVSAGTGGSHIGV